MEVGPHSETHAAGAVDFATRNLMKFIKSVKLAVNTKLSYVKTKGKLRTRHQ